MRLGVSSEVSVEAHFVLTTQHQSTMETPELCLLCAYYVLTTAQIYSFYSLVFGDLRGDLFYALFLPMAPGAAARAARFFMWSLIYLLAQAFAHSYKCTCCRVLCG